MMYLTAILMTVSACTQKEETIYFQARDPDMELTSTSGFRPSTKNVDLDQTAEPDKAAQHHSGRFHETGRINPAVIT